MFENRTEDTSNPDLVSGNWIMRCEARTLEDIRALGGNDAADERRFATAARVSETNLALYRTFVQPTVRALVKAPAADLMRQMHPLRLQYELVSDANPFMVPIAALAEQVRANRQPAGPENPFLMWQENVSRQVVAALDGWRDFSEAMAERTFLAVYGAPTLQAAASVDKAYAQRKVPKSLLHGELLQTRIAELKSCIPLGGLREAIIRSVLYVGMGRGAVDERGFEAVRRIRATHGELPLADFKKLVREQFFMLLLDPEAALAAVPAMLPDDAELRAKALDMVAQVLRSTGAFSTEDERRMRRVGALFGMEGALPASKVAALPSPRKETKKAS